MTRRQRPLHGLYVGRSRWRGKVDPADLDVLQVELDRLEGWTQGGPAWEVTDRACMYMVRHGMGPREAARAAHAWDENLREQATRRRSHDTGCT